MTPPLIARTPHIVALLTDFGHEDAFVGVMKGVILSRAPGARLVDLCHGIPPQDVRAAAFQLRAAVPYFRDGTLFVCVVDPGVGSARAALWARTDRHAFLAPDNGLLSWVGPLREVRRLENARLFLSPVSATFHGRDVFAPCAGALAAGLEPKALGPAARPRVRLAWPEPRRAGRTWRGEIVARDRFGNAVTNLSLRHLGPRRKVEVRGQAIPLKSFYGQARPGTALAVLGSAGLLELAVAGGDFFEGLRVDIGEAVHVR